MYLVFVGLETENKSITMRGVSDFRLRYMELRKKWDKYHEDDQISIGGINEHIAGMSEMRNSSRNATT